MDIKYLTTDKMKYSDIFYFIQTLKLKRHKHIHLFYFCSIFNVCINQISISKLVYFTAVNVYCEIYLTYSSA